MRVDKKQVVERLLNLQLHKFGFREGNDVHITLSHSSYMGKIDIPVKTVSNTNKADAIPEVAPNFDAAVDYVKSEVEDTPDSLSLTNEAIRLIDLKMKLGIDASSRENDHELKGILDLARAKGIKNKNQLQAYLKEIQYKVGMSDTGQERVKKIYEYIKLDHNIQSLVNKQVSLYGNK